MPKTRSIPLSLLVLFALGAIVSTTASANSTHIFVIEGTALTSGSESVEGSAGLSLQKIETRIAKLLVVKECQEDIGTSEIKPEGQTVGRAEGKNCHLYEDHKGKKVLLSACQIKEPLEFAFTGEVLEHGVGIVEGASEKERFAEIEIKGEGCALNGKFEITGSQTCTSRESAFEKTIHEASCTPAESKLRFGKEPAQLFGTGLAKLKSGKTWSST